jgi:RNA polymerase sigma factor (sigma-70 family)
MTVPSAQDLFERHHLVVFRFLRRMTGDTALAEDLTQEVFLRLVRGIQSYQDRSRELSWLFRIARNLLVDRRRKNGHWPQDVPLHEVLANPRPAMQGLTVALEEALARLPERPAFCGSRPVWIGMR